MSIKVISFKYKINTCTTTRVVHVLKIYQSNTLIINYLYKKLTYLPDFYAQVFHYLNGTL